MGMDIFVTVSPYFWHFHWRFVNDCWWQMAYINVRVYMFEMVLSAIRKLHCVWKWSGRVCCFQFLHCITLYRNDTHWLRGTRGRTPHSEWYIFLCTNNITRFFFIRIMVIWMQMQRTRVNILENKFFISFPYFIPYMGISKPSPFKINEIHTKRQKQELSKKIERKSV